MAVNMKNNISKKVITAFLSLAICITMSCFPLTAATDGSEVEYCHLANSVLTSEIVSSEGLDSQNGISKSDYINGKTFSVDMALNGSAADGVVESFSVADTDGKSLSSQISKAQNSVSIDSLVPETPYVFESVVNTAEGETYLRGSVEAIYDVDDVLIAHTSVFDFTELVNAANSVSSNNLKSSGSVSLDNESPDSTSTTPRTIAINQITRGIIHSTNDEDYYSFTVVNSGIMDVKLLVPDNSGMNLVLRVYRLTSGNVLTLVGTSANSGTTDEFVRVNNVVAGNVYIIKVPSVSGTVNSSYYLQIENRAAKAWFPQAKGNVGTANYYWNTNKLDTLYYYDEDSAYKQFTDNASEGEDGMTKGCSMAAVAMVLANMGAQTSDTTYDFRLSNYSYDGSVQYYSGYLSPDPYIVFLRNNNQTGSGITYSSGTYTLPGTGYTMSAYWATIATRFGKTITTYSATNLSGYSDLTAILNTIPSTALSNGVLLRFSTHTIVITKENGSYYVYDPGRANTSYCGMELSYYMANNNKDISTTTPPTVKYTYSDILWIRTLS